MRAMIKNKCVTTLRDFSSSVEHYDMFICCSSFEERCLALASSISLDTIGTALVCQYVEPAQLSLKNHKKLMDLMGDKATEVSFDKDSPLAIYDTFYDVIQKRNPKSILLDISTFTRETILIALMLFRQDAFSEINVTLGYVPADRYSWANKDGINETWLSKGVSEIRTVLGYAGSYSSLKKTLLVVLVGFEMERANILISNFEADKLYLGSVPPEESYNEELSNINKDNFKRLVSLVGTCNTFEFSCRNLEQTHNVLKQIVEENRDNYNIIISPMNNKLSTLAVATVAFDYPEVQICYASTNQYNTEAYSSPTNKVVLFDLSNQPK